MTCAGCTVMLACCEQSAPGSLKEEDTYSALRETFKPVAVCARAGTCASEMISGNKHLDNL